MPEYLAPGVYVEETSFRSKSIEGVSTTTTGFIGPARYGPLDLEPEIVTSLGEFERQYGDRQQLNFSDAAGMDNYLWHAVRAFFEEGGKRVYISRVFRPTADDDDGRASGTMPAGGGAGAITIRARFPGEAGNMRVRFDLLVGQNVLGTDENGDARVAGLADGDVVWMGDTTSPTGSPLGTGQLHRASFNQETQAWIFRASGSPGGELGLDQLDADGGDVIRVVTVSVTVIPNDPTGFPETWAALPVEPGHVQAGMPDSLSAKFAAQPNNLAQARTLPIVIELGNDVGNGIDVLTALLGLDAVDFADPDEPLFAEVSLTGGNDGMRPTASEYEGVEEPGKTGLKMFEDLDDISIVAAPGSTFGYENGYRADANTIINLLISHARRMRYRIAVLDSGAGQSISQVRAMRAKFDSTYAALYYPWVRVLDPVTRKEIHLPPSGFVAGIYARNDINRAVYKAPANEVVNLALGFEKLLNKSQQDVLNPEGINCFRFFEGRGFRLWGARTISSDPEWKYVNLRRYFAYLEHSIDKGTQWAVFEPNGEQLWGNVRRTVEDFMFNEWQMGALLGDKPEKAYFVKCDRSTMTQNDLDNGRLVCLIGLAPLRPAEFVIFRIGQWTADRKV
ncbi:MAG TPA: phage tail sheath subtilisin-like domain-containing protein [Pyrinomonadaceae bacterium]|nr:phage tail sheath subtilisin-like domain-containing protein [Pyrinomonadaceae bacterium]